MASVFTNRGLYLVLGIAFRNETAPTNFYGGLATSATTPTVDTNTFGELTEIATGNNYSSGGSSKARSSAGFDVWTEDDTNNWALVQAADWVYTASGGPIPASGNGARWFCITDDNGTVGSRQVFGAFDLVSDRSVSDGQSLTIQDAEFRIGH